MTLDEDSASPPAATATARDATTERVVKKRASQACHHCRSRKVKCDLVKSGVPCHNCATDGIDCIILESKRSRKYRLQKRQLSRLVSLPPISQAQPKSTTREAAAVVSPSRAPRISSSSGPNSEAAAGIVKNAPSSYESSRAPSVNPNYFQSPSAVTPNAISIGAQSYVGGRLSNTPGAVSSTTALPAYIRPCRPNLPPEDIDFLRRRGALNLPANELRDQLLRAFVLYVHPFMPIVHLEGFVGALDGQDTSPKISLILFQAVMFAGAAFVDLQYLQEAGYASRRAARGDLYQKIKLLYDFDWEVDRISLIQSLLFMNYWYVSENDQKDPWHWLGICVSLASSIGLNQPITYGRKDPETCRLWRRIWWTCVMRDRIISISMRRPMRVKNEDLMLHPLTLDDFETRSISAVSVPTLRDCAFLTDGYTRTMLAEMCMAKVRLLVLIGHILRNFYHLRGFGGSTAEATMLYTPRRADIDGQLLSSLQRDLDTWYSDLPMSCWLVMTSDDINADYPDPSTADVLLVHRSVLWMLFLMASEALNRPQSLSKSQQTPSEKFSTSKVKEAADKIAEMVQALQERDLVRFLPPLSVSFLLLSLASFIVEIKTKAAGTGTLPAQQFHHCIRALFRLRDIWPIADSACFLIGQMISKKEEGTSSIPGIQPEPMAVSDPPSNVWRLPPPRNLKHESQTPQPNLNDFNDPPPPHTGFARLDNDLSQFSAVAAATLEPPPDDTPITTTDVAATEAPAAATATTSTAGFAIPYYNWTEEGFDGDTYSGVVTDAHALNMDLGMPEYDILGGFEKGFLDFEPSPNDDQMGGAPDALPSYLARAGGVVVPEPWSSGISTRYPDTLRSPGM